MILQLGFSTQIRIIAGLAGAFDWSETRKCVSMADLGSAYRRFLQGLNQRSIEQLRECPKIIVDREEALMLVGNFSNDSLLDDKGQADVVEYQADPYAEEKKSVIEKALQDLHEISPEHAALFSLIITDVFLMPSGVARGGSTSQAVGVIWANPKNTYSQADSLELMLHELTHHAMFLDELRFGHYKYRAMMDRSTWAQSAILGVMRPLDKVLHSIVVSAEVLLMRHFHLGDPDAPKVHPPTPLMLEQFYIASQSANESVQKYPDVLSRRGVEILQLAQRRVCQSYGASPL